jgi:thymidylate synthase
MVLPPCHYGFQVYTRELSARERKNIYDKSPYIKDILPTDENGWNQLFDGYNIPTRAISLMFNMRSNDVPLGLPFNLASYGLLLEILGIIVNMVPDELIANLGDAHVYLNQIDGVKEQLTREPFELPSLRINTEFWPTQTGECGEGLLSNDIGFIINNMQITDFQIENYKSHPAIKIPLSN